MNRKVCLLLLAVLFMAGCGSGGTAPPLPRDALQQTLETQWQAYSSGKPNFGGGVAMQILSLQGDYFLSTGMGEQMTNLHHFRAASCTKTLTAAAIMLLYQRGMLEIEDTITANVPGTNTPYVPATADFDIPNKGQITIRMLLMHRAGVFDVTNDNLPDTVPPPYGGRSYLDVILEQDPFHQFSFDELVGVVAKYRPSYPFAPGGDYHYSNTGYSILGKIVERVSGRAYADFVRTELLAPNGLAMSSLPTDAREQGLPSPFVDGYVWDGTTLMNATISNISGNVAEGNLITTPLDLARWCHRLLRGEAGLYQSTVDMMKSGEASGQGGAYGLGISYAPRLGFGHTGAHEGYLTLMFYRPATEVTFVLFANVWDGSNGVTSIGNQSIALGEMANTVLAQLGY
ncbi:MAG: serine hydrolase domain-containing protein [Syntrophales bacterium]